MAYASAVQTCADTTTTMCRAPWHSGRSVGDGKGVVVPGLASVGEGGEHGEGVPAVGQPAAVVGVGGSGGAAGEVVGRLRVGAVRGAGHGGVVQPVLDGGDGAGAGREDVGVG